MIRITIDTREQQAWSFPEGLVLASRGTLLSGDYAIQDDRGFAVERKSVNDLVGTLTTGWARFLEELARMEEFAFPNKVIIVEGTLTDIIDRKYNHPKVVPKYIINQIARLTLKGCSVLFCDNPISAAGMAYAILLKRYEQLEEEFESVRDGSNDNDPQDPIPKA